MVKCKSADVLYIALSYISVRCLYKLHIVLLHINVKSGVMANNPIAQNDVDVRVQIYTSLSYKYIFMCAFLHLSGIHTADVYIFALLW